MDRERDRCDFVRRNNLGLGRWQPSRCASVQPKTRAQPCCPPRHRRAAAVGAPAMECPPRRRDARTLRNARTPRRCQGRGQDQLCRQPERSGETPPPSPPRAGRAAPAALREAQTTPNCCHAAAPNCCHSVTAAAPRTHGATRRRSPHHRHPTTKADRRASSACSRIRAAEHGAAGARSGLDRPPRGSASS